MNVETDVVGRLWGFAHNLRHDGVDYGDYIEQITYLLFLKMADEQAITEIPAECDWPHLRRLSGVALTEGYEDALRTLGKQLGILGDIFAASQNRLSNPATLAQLIKSIDETEWTSLNVDVKAAAFEGLLEKAAAEGKKGAGQYFTPRPLIESMVRLVQPDPRMSRGFTIGDPACGTGGFLVAAYDWLKAQTGGAFEREDAKRIRTQTYYGQDLVARPRRLALMNLYLHQVEPHIALGDSIYETPTSQRFDVILTNPPFGTKGANQAPVRDDFVVETSNKQLNFLQHVLTLLKPGGRCAIVVPDNVLFADRAGEVFKVLMEDCNVHTVLRCPRGTFAPYTTGTKTNVLFFTKGEPTKQLWVYDGRANVPMITKKSRPLSAAHFTAFERCFGDDPNGRGKRSVSDSPDDRWRSFTLDEIIERDYKIDSFRWLRDDELDDPDQTLDPAELVTRTIAELEAAVAELHQVQRRLDHAGVAALDASSGAWRDLTLGDVARWSSGGTPKAGTAEYYGGDIPWAVIGDLNDGVVTSTASTITEAGLSNSSAKVVQAGTILVAMYGSIGKLGVAGIPMATNQAIACAVPNPGIDRQYLFHYLKSQRENLLQAGKGGAQQNISQTVLKRWPISVPPEDEQRRVAAQLDAIEASRASIADRLTSAHSGIDRLLAGVFAAACSGRLPADRRAAHDRFAPPNGAEAAESEIDSECGEIPDTMVG